MSRIAQVRAPYAVVDAEEKGVGFPFLRGQEGLFSRRFGLDVIIDDIVALIHIMPGEYPNDPELGIGINKYLFELEDPGLSLDIEDRIEKQVNAYIENINLIGVDVTVIGESKEIEVNIRFQKKNGSRDVIKLTDTTNSNGSSTLSVGVAS